MAHTLAKWRSGAYATLTVGQDQTFDIGIVRASENCGYMGAEQAPLIRVANDTAAVHNYLCAVASNTGKIWIKTAANVAEGACLTVATGIHVPDIYEFDQGVQSSGTIELLAAPNLVTDGDTITISDGTTALTFEFDDGAVGNDGRITVASVVDGDTVTFHGKTYEFDIGVRATGALTFIAQPADGQTFTLRDGTNTVVFEFDDTAERADGSITLAAGNATANDIITIDDGTNPAVNFEADGAGANVNFVIGGTNLVTMANLYAAILAQHAAGNLDIVPTNGGAGTITLLHDLYGVVGNQAIVETVDTGGTWSHVGMANGVDAIVIGTNVPVKIRGTKELTATETYVEINYQHGLTNIEITATNGTASVVSLTNDNYGIVGNTNIDTTSHAITENNMTGGLDAGAGPVGAGNIAVAIGATDTDDAHNLTVALIANDVFLPASTHLLGVVTMACTLPLTGYNGAVTENTGGTRIVTVDCTNGFTPGEGIILGNVGVVIAATNILTAVNLRAAIIPALFDVSCTAITVPGTVPVYNLNYGANNVAMVDSTAGARMTATGMAGGAAAGGAVQAGHKAVAKGTTPAVTLANLATALTTNVATSHIVPGTVYTDTIDGVAVTVLPYSGAANTDRIAVCWSTDADDLIVPANGWPVANVSCKIGTTEYEQNGIGLVEVDEVVTGFPTETHLSQTDVVSAPDSGDPLPFAYLYIDKTDRGNVVAGPITANILFVPILDTATFAHSAFAAGGDLIVATGIVKSGR